MAKTKIPDNAIRITFRHFGVAYSYYIWQHNEEMWIWEALGNSGVGKTKEEASELARRWITHGQ